jgi:ketopantoate reductase
LLGESPTLSAIGSRKCLKLRICLRAKGLSIRSHLRDVHLAMPSLVTADQLTQPYDLVVLSCKAYDLEDALRSLAPSVGSDMRSSRF